MRASGTARLPVSLREKSGGVPTREDEVTEVVAITISSSAALLSERSICVGDGTFVSM